MRCPSEMSSVCGVTLGVGTAPVDAVDVIGKGPSIMDVHGVESKTGSKTSPEALEWLEVAEISSPIDIQSAKTGAMGCVDARLVSRLLGMRLASLVEKRCVTKWKIFGVSRVAQAEISVLSSTHWISSTRFLSSNRSPSTNTRQWRPR